MLTVPWFIARTVQKAWTYNNPEIPSSGGVRTTLTTSEQSAESRQQQKQQQQQQQQQPQQQPQKEQQQQQPQQQPKKQQQPHQQPGIGVAASKVSPAQSAPTRAIPRPKPASSGTPAPHLDSSTKTSKKTLLLTPSVSGGKMGDQWAQQQVDKFSFDFDKADTDKSGSLSIQEVLDVLKTVGFKGSETEGLYIFSHLDKNKDRKISREEFSAAMKGLPKLAIKEFVLRKAFLSLDKDQSGFLSRAEIEDATKRDAGIEIASDKISDLLIYLCKEDKDGQVDYEEFLRVFGVESTAGVMETVFTKLDTDKSGFLSREEILAAVKAENELKLSAGKISDLLCAWCKDDDKKISYNEFVQVWMKQKAPKKK